MDEGRQESDITALLNRTHVEATSVPIPKAFHTVARLPFAERVAIRGLANGGVMKNDANLGRGGPRKPAKGFEVVEVKRLPGRYWISQDNLPEILGGYKEVADLMRQHADGELSDEKAGNLYKLSRQVDWFTESVRQQPNKYRIFAVVNKKQQMHKPGGYVGRHPVVYGVGIISVEGSEATYETVIAHPLTQHPNGNAWADRYRDKLQSLSARRTAPEGTDFNLSGIGNTLGIAPFFRLARRQNIEAVGATAMNERTLAIVRRMTRWATLNPAEALARLLLRRPPESESGG
jgi:hypothetical protein